MPVIPELGRLRQEDPHKFKATLGYIRDFQASLNYLVRACFKKETFIHPHPLKMCPRILPKIDSLVPRIPFFCLNPGPLH